jgi:DNA-binding response OmpR family regulator
VRVLVVDDDRVFADIVAFALRREGFQVIEAYDGLVALQRWIEDQPDLIVLDVNLPKMDGFTVCQRIRKQADTPIILLTVRSSDEDIICGLEAGADVYMTKPFSPRQLVARAQALLRRSRTPSYVFSDRMDKSYPTANHWSRIPFHSLQITLTPKERKLLDCLKSCPGQTVSFDTLICQVWGGQTEGDRIVLRQLIHRLRLKLEPDPAHPTYIKTIPGIGYQLATVL